MNYAMVIGINEYETRPLRGAVQDAKRFAQWLRDTNQVNDSELELLVSDTGNRIATHDDVDAAFLKILKSASTNRNEKNRFYFYFSGHGVGVSYLNTGLCLRMWKDDMPSYNISSSAYQDFLVNQAVFDEIIVFLDCCRDYDFLVDPRKPSLNVTYSGARRTDVLICYSTLYGKVSHEIMKESSTEAPDDHDSKRGAFTSFLIEGLQGDADTDGDGIVSGDDLLTHIEQNFRSYALKFRKQQDADGTVSAGGRNIQVCKVSKTNLGYNYIIKFTRDSNITLFDGSNDPIQDAISLDVVAGQELKIQLPKGLIKVVDNNTGQEKYFTNFNLNTLANEQF